MNGFILRRWRHGLVTLAAVAVVLTFAVPAPLASAARSSSDKGSSGDASAEFKRRVEVRFSWLTGFDDPATPDRFNRVGVLKVGPESARNVLVLNPGTSAGAGYFLPLARDVVRATRGRWQVWSVERRENLLEDQSVLDKFKHGEVTPQQFSDYYLGWLANPAITKHFQLIPDAAVSFARGWGLNVEMEDLHRVVQAAHDDGRRVVLGGHSLGGSIVTAYATWDFHGKAGAADLAGLVFIDGGSSPTPVTPQQATQSLTNLQHGSPWLAFGGIPAPYLGLFSAIGSTLAVMDPNDPAILQGFPLLPANLKAPVRVTNEAGFGYAVSVGTSPPNLLAAQVHAGHLAASGDPRSWDRAGAITPIQRWANMLSGTGLTGVDGSAWYHPMRLTIDAGAVANGNPNPAQNILNIKSIHGHDLDKDLLIYAFGAALGGQRVLDTTRALAHQSGIPDRDLTLVNRQSTYSHNDPSAASPENDFLDNLVPFLATVATHH
jgi:pimeloyl-ACP methyl ester carboxylesterase